MKKLIILFSSLIGLSLLGWYAYHLSVNKGKSSTELISFNIEDTTAVDRIIISDPFGQRFEIVKNDKTWTDKDGGCITQESVHFILDAFKNIEFKGYLPENSRKQQMKLISSQHIKVEIFENGDWTKTWYIGSASQDHYGQVMLLDSDEDGKSDLPVLMKIKGMHGIIEPRFFADPRKWSCTKIFGLTINQIASVDVKYFDEPSRSFTVTKKGTKMDVYQQGQKLPGVDTAMIFRYLNNYKKIHYELANYELNDKAVDSLKKTTPFAVLTLKETSGKSTKLRMFRIPSEEPQQNDFGAIVDVDMNKFWCELPSGDMVKCQYHVFYPIILGHIYFPMNTDKIKKGDGVH